MLSCLIHSVLLVVVVVYKTTLNNLFNKHIKLLQYQVLFMDIDFFVL